MSNHILHSALGSNSPTGRIQNSYLKFAGNYYELQNTVNDIYFEVKELVLPLERGFYKHLTKEETENLISRLFDNFLTSFYTLYENIKFETNNNYHFTFPEWSELKPNFDKLAVISTAKGLRKIFQHSESSNIQIIYKLDSDPVIEALIDIEQIKKMLGETGSRKLNIEVKELLTTYLGTFGLDSFGAKINLLTDEILIQMTTFCEVITENYFRIDHGEQNYKWRLDEGRFGRTF
jgi:hypothetical protein